MPNDPVYNAVLSTAGVRLRQARDAFREDPRVLWKDLGDNVRKVQAQAGVAALKETTAHHKEIARNLS